MIKDIKTLHQFQSSSSIELLGEIPGTLFISRLDVLGLRLFFVVWSGTKIGDPILNLSDSSTSPMSKSSRREVDIGMLFLFVVKVDSAWEEV